MTRAMANEHFLTVAEFQELARPTSRHVDEGEVMAFVRECEDIYIAPTLGLDKCTDLLADEVSEADKILLEGGTYTDKEGKKQRCAGVKITLAYFVYGKMTMADGGIMTRSGVVLHNDNYADRYDDKNRVRRYDDVLNVAEEYLNSCLNYLRTLEGYEEHPKARGTRILIHSIGD